MMSLSVEKKSLSDATALCDDSIEMVAEEADWYACEAISFSEEATIHSVTVLWKYLISVNISNDYTWLSICEMKVIIVADSQPDWEAYVSII